MSFENELKASIDAAYSVRDFILEIYNSPDFGIEIKSDDSPVTKADKGTDVRLRNYLSNLFPDYGFLTEESVDDLSRLNKDYVFIIDPIDGTTEFIAKNGQYTVCIGLAYKHKAVMGVILVPASGELFYAVKGEGCFYKKDKDSEPRKIHTSDRLDNLKVVMSRSHFTVEEENVISRHKDKISSFEHVGSSLKGCLIAKGDADYCLRISSKAKEWDLCAMEVIVEEAGGYFIKLDGTESTYNNEDVYNHGGYIIINRKENYLL